MRMDALGEAFPSPGSGKVWRCVGPKSSKHYGAGIDASGEGAPFLRMGDVIIARLAGEALALLAEDVDEAKESKTADLHARVLSVAPPMAGGCALSVTSSCLSMSAKRL